MARKPREETILAGLYLDDAKFEVVSEENPRDGETLVRMDIDEIHEHPQNNFSMDENGIIALAHDIEKNGILQTPLAWINQDEETELLSGHRRLRAVKWLRENGKDPSKWETIEVRIKYDIESPAEALLILHSANFWTRTLKQSEKARSIAALSNEADEMRANDENLRGKRTRELIALHLSNVGETISPASVVRYINADKFLISELKKLWDANILNNSQVDTLCKEKADIQLAFYEKVKDLDEKLSSANFKLYLGEIKKPKQEVNHKKLHETVVYSNSKTRTTFRKTKKALLDLHSFADNGFAVRRSELEELKVLVEKLEETCLED